MKDIYEIIAENKKEAIEILKGVDGHVLDIENNDTYIIVCDKHGCLEDIQVSKVCLSESEEEISMFIQEWGEWISVYECCSTSENNVYLSIEETINGGEDEEENDLI